MDFEAPARVSKNPKLGLEFLDFWNFGKSRNLLDFWIVTLPLEFPKKSETWVGIFGFLEFWKVEEFARFLAPARVSKNPKLGLGFLGFWIFGNSRNFGVLVFRPLPGQTGNAIPGSVVGGGGGGVTIYIYIYMTSSQNDGPFWGNRKPQKGPTLVCVYIYIHTEKIRG